MKDILTNGFLHLAGALYGLGDALMKYRLIQFVVFNRIIIIVLLICFNAIFVEFLPDGTGTHHDWFDFLPETAAYNFQGISEAILIILIWISLLYGSKRTSNLASVVVGTGFVPSLIYEVYYQFNYERLYDKWYMLKPLGYNLIFIVVMIVVYAIVLDQIIKRRSEGRINGEA